MMTYMLVVGYSQSNNPHDTYVSLYTFTQPEYTSYRSRDVGARAPMCESPSHRRRRMLEPLLLAGGYHKYLNQARRS